MFSSRLFQKNMFRGSWKFSSFLRAEEEAEISCRLRNKGYNLYFLDYESAYHYRPHTDPFREMRRRKTTGLYPGMGDMFSWCLRKGYYTILWERFKVFFFLECLLDVRFLGF